MSKDILPKIDLFGTSVVFNVGGNPKSKSQHGAICTIIFIIFVGWAIYHTSQDLFGRKDPKTNYAEAFNEDARAMEITPDKFVFAFGVQGNAEALLTHFIDETIYIPFVYFLRRTYNESQELTWDQIPLDIERCTLEHFGDMNASFANLPLNDLYCLKKDQQFIQDLIIQGSSDSKMYGFIDVAIAKCNVNNSAVECTDRTIIDDTLAGSYFAMYFSNMAVNPKQSARPDIRYRDLYITMLCPTCYKASTLSLKHVTVTTDYGWLLEDMQVKTFAQIGPAWEQLDLRPSATDYLIDCTIEVDKLEKIYTRSYVKIKDILAEVDGLATSCMLAFFILMRPFSQLKVQESLINEVFNIKQSQKNKNKKKKSRATLNTQNTYRATTLELKTLRDTDTQTVRTQHEAKGQTKGSFKQLGAPTLSIESPKSSLLPKDTQNLETYAMKFRKQLAEEMAKGANNTSSIDSETGGENELSPKKLTESPGRVKWAQKNLLDIVVPQREDVKVSSQKDLLSPGLSRLSHHSHFALNPESSRLPAKQVPEGEDPEALSCFSEILNQSNDEKEGKKQEKEKEVINLDNILQVEDKPPASNNKDGKYWMEVKSSEQQDDKKVLVSDADNQNDNENLVEENQDEELDDSGKISIGFWEYIRSYVWKSQALKDKIALLNAGKRNIEERMDILNIMKKFREIDKLKALLLEDHQLILFEGLPKPEISLDSEGVTSNSMGSIAQTILRKPKFVEENKKQDQIFISYNVLKNKQRKTKVDQKLLAIYDEIIDPLVGLAVGMRKPLS